MWGYATNGLIKTAQDSVDYAKLFGSASYIGDLRIKDVNGDGKIDSKDQVVVGDANPKWIWGLTNNFSWRHFDLNTLFTAVRGNSIINTQRMQWLILNGQQGNIPRDILAQSWNPTTNPDGTLPMLRNNRGGFGGRFLDVFAEDGSYVRLKNVQLGYQLTNVPAVQSARIYINAINLITWSNYSGFDPEVSAFGGTDRPGVDQGSYPGSRTINVGVNTSF